MIILPSSLLFAQKWSVGVDLISLGNLFSETPNPAILQIRRSLNDRHALRLNLGVHHVSRRRDWDYFNSGNGFAVLDDVSLETSFQYSGRIGWECNISDETDRFRLYAYSGALVDYSKYKIDKIDYVIPGPGQPREDKFIYPFTNRNNSRLDLGLFLIPGLEVRVTEKFSLALESEIRGAFYQEDRYEQEFYWVVDWNAANRVMGFGRDGHYYDEQGFELRASVVQYLFVRYRF